MSSCSESEHEGFTCVWIIENFELCRSTRKIIIQSQIFEVSLWNNFQFHLEIRRTEDNFFDACIFKENFGSDIYLHYSVSLLRSDGTILKYGSNNNKFISGGDGYGTPELIKWGELFNNLHSLSSYLRNGSLLISFHMWKDNTKDSAKCFLISQMINKKNTVDLSRNYIRDLKQNTWIQLIRFFSQTIEAVANKTCTDLNEETKIRTDKVSTTEASIQTDTNELKNVSDDADDLLHFFAEEKFSYVTLRTVNKDFAVHKALLCARSPIFRAMFYNHMKESVTSIVDIDDVDSETLSLLLQFLHLQPLEELKWKTAAKLYYAADKYQIEQLKNECRSHLKNKLTIETVCELLELSNIHEDKDLKLYAQEYFCRNSKLILRTNEWDDFLLDKTELAREILRVYAENP